MENKVMLAGYGLTLLCFAASLLSRVSHWGISSVLIGIGGALLTATSLYRVFVKKKKR